jgi:primosomal replication protein N
MLLGAAFLGACAGSLPSDLPPAVEVQLVNDASGLLARVEFTGSVEAMAPEAWTVSGQTVGITPQTEIRGTIAVGDAVDVRAEVGTDGALTAREIALSLGASTVPEPEKEAFEFFGTIEDMGADAWTVSGQVVAVNAETEIKDTFAVGDEVKVHALVEADGSLTAIEIGPAVGLQRDDFHEGEIEFTAQVEEIGTEAWLIGGRSVALDASTQIEAGILVGDMVEVHAFLSPEGALTASRIKLEEDGNDNGFGTPGMEFELTGLVEAMGPDSWTVSGHVFLITSTTEIDQGIVIGSQVKVEGIVGQDGAYTAREIKLNHDDDGEGDDSGASGSKFGTSGIVESIGEGSWTIGGQVFLITPDTEIEEGIVVGSRVKVEAFVGTDGSFTAHEIELEDETEIEDQHQGDASDGRSGSDSEDTDHEDSQHDDGGVRGDDD